MLNIGGRLMNIQKEKKIFLGLIILQPIFDIIAYFQYNNVIGSLAGYSRLLVMLILPIYVLIKTNKKKTYLLIMGSIGIFSLLHIVNGFRVGYNNMFQDIAYLLRVIQMPVLTVSFIYYMRMNDDYMNVSSKGYFLNCIIVTVVIIISTLTNTNETTYAEVGLLGWFGNSNSQSIILTCLVPFALYFLLKKEVVWQFLLGLVMTTFMLLSNGTKGAYYSAFLIYIGFACFMLFKALINKKLPPRFQIFAILLFFCASAASAALYPITPRYFMDNEYFSARANEEEEMAVELEKITNPENKEGNVLDVNDPIVYNELVTYYEPKMNKGIVKKFGVDRVLKAYGYTPDPYTLSDNRLVKRMYAQFIWDDSDFITKLIGFEFSKIDDFDLENDFPAIYYYYGYIGFVLYCGFLLYFFFQLLLRVIKHFKSAMTVRNFTLLLTLCLLLGLAQYSGALLRRPNGSIYLSIVLALIYIECKRPIETKE